MSSCSFSSALVHSGAPRSRRVQSGSRGFTLAHLVNFGFIQVHVGSLRRALGSQGSYRFPWLQQCALRGRRVHLVVRKFKRARLVVFVFFRFSMGLLLGAKRSSGSFGFA